jgi:diacylglycerol kinase (ATP)
MATARRIRIIVNPSAHSGRARRFLRHAARHQAQSTELRLEWIESRSAADLGELVRQAQLEELDALALAGGDGTMTLALGALGGPNRVPLALLPVGSGNDFAHDLGIPRRLPEALAVLATGVPRWVDVARTIPGEVRFCCVASVGLDELALRFIHGSWFPRSKALNIWASLRALWTYRPRAVRVVWQGGSCEGEVMFVAVTNTRGYGGGFLVSPRACVDDGLLDLCIVRRTPRGRLLWNFPRILQGTHDVMPEVTLTASPWVRIQGVSEPLPVALDGELPRTATPIELRCEPRAVQMLVPAPVAEKRFCSVESLASGVAGAESSKRR